MGNGLAVSGGYFGKAAIHRANELRRQRAPISVIAIITATVQKRA
jgi:hypothetical protein